MLAGQFQWSQYDTGQQFKPGSDISGHRFFGFSPPAEVKRLPSLWEHPRQPLPSSSPRRPTEASDREALIALHDATRGENWNNNRNGIEVWEVDDENSDISSWHRVTVNSAHRVTELSLYSNNLRYDRDHRNSLPPELGNLAYLWSLHLSGNALRGSIPDAFGNLGNLVELLLDKNNLSGNIPASFGQPDQSGIIGSIGQQSVRRNSHWAWLSSQNGCCIPGWKQPVWMHSRRVAESSR